MYIVIVGNPVDGFDYYGPFANHTDAIEWADSGLAGTPWWLAALQSSKA